MKEKEALKFKAADAMVPCWILWEAAADGGRPKIIAIDTSEEQVNLHVYAKLEEARVQNKPPPQLRVEGRWLRLELRRGQEDHEGGPTRYALRAQVTDLKTHLRRAVDLARAAVKYSFHDRDSAHDDLDDLAKLEKVL